MEALQSGDTVAIVIRQEARREGRDVETGVFVWRNDNGDVAIKQGKSRLIIPAASISMILF